MAREGERILVVDDDPESCKLLAYLAAAAGREVATAADGHEALAQLAVLAPQVVVSDIYMPNLDGVGLLEAIKTQAPETEVVLLTGASDTALGVTAIRAGAADYIVKPVDPGAFAVVLQ